MITEKIASVNGVVFKGKEYFIVVTASGKSIWVPKNKMDNSAETITYKEMKAGDSYVKKGINGAADETKTLLQDRLEFLGCGKQTKAANAIEVFTALNALGIVPAIAL